MQIQMEQEQEMQALQERESQIRQLEASHLSLFLCTCLWMFVCRMCVCVCLHSRVYNYITPNTLFWLVGNINRFEPYPIIFTIHSFSCTVRHHGREPDLQGLGNNGPWARWSCWFHRGQCGVSSGACVPGLHTAHPGQAVSGRTLSLPLMFDGNVYFSDMEKMVMFDILSGRNNSSLWVVNGRWKGFNYLSISPLSPICSEPLHPYHAFCLWSMSPVCIHYLFYSMHVIKEDWKAWCQRTGNIPFYDFTIPAKQEISIFIYIILFYYVILDIFFFGCHLASIGK